MATTEIEREFIENERRFLKQLSGTGFAPEIINDTVQEFIKEKHYISDESDFYRSCVWLLLTLRRNKIRHGDLTRKNIVVRNNKPVAIDFMQSKFYDESGPDKRPEGDAYHLWNAALTLVNEYRTDGDSTRRMRRWLAMRDHIKGRGVLDLGCAQGDFCAFAYADKGVWAHGVDWNEDEVLMAESLWAEPNNPNGPTFEHRDLIDIDLKFEAENVFLLSVFGHIVSQLPHGRKQADALMYNIFHSKIVDRLFFETHLDGDGPGGFENDREVFDYLNKYGAVTWLAQIPVYGQDRKSRSLWMVEK